MKAHEDPPTNPTVGPAPSPAMPKKARRWFAWARPERKAKRNDRP